VATSSRGEPRVSFNLINFYHNFPLLPGVDSYGLTARQAGKIAAGLRRGFETAGGLRSFRLRKLRTRTAGCLPDWPKLNTCWVPDSEVKSK
jgi:hypothetical protein